LLQFAPLDVLAWLQPQDLFTRRLAKCRTAAWLAKSLSKQHLCPAH